MAKNNNLTDFLTDVADAIREKKSTTAPINPQDFAAEIKSIGGTPSPDTRPSGYLKVTFIDIDGTTLKTQYVPSGGSATPPANPTREYCTFVKWVGNYTNLTHDSVVGPQYKSSDGKTRMKIKVGKYGIHKFSLKHSGTTECSVDWGDGTVETVSSKSSLQTLSHTYNADFEGWIALAIDKSDTLTLANDFKWGIIDYIEGRKITRLENSTFSVYYSLQSIVIPDSVTSIMYNVFEYCYSLQSIVIPDGVTSIRNYAFSYCYSLQSIVLPDSVTSIGNSAFLECHSLNSIVLPDSVTSIGNYAFSYCYSLQSIVIPDSVTSIMYGVFNNCSSLQSIVIPDNVTSIMDNAFIECRSLHSIVIPDSVTSIGSSAFSYCYSLFIISCLATTPPTLSETLSWSNLIAIYVPDDSVGAYKAATNWTGVANKIRPLSQY